MKRRPPTSFATPCKNWPMARIRPNSTPCWPRKTRAAWTRPVASACWSSCKSRAAEGSCRRQLRPHVREHPRRRSVPNVGFHTRPQSFRIAGSPKRPQQIPGDLMALNRKQQKPAARKPAKPVARVAAKPVKPPVKAAKPVPAAAKSSPKPVAKAAAPSPAPKTLPPLKPIAAPAPVPAKGAKPAKPGKNAAPAAAPAAAKATLPPQQVAALVAAQSAPPPGKPGRKRRGQDAADAEALSTIERRAPVMPEERQSQLKLLIALGKEQSFLTYSQVNDHLPSEIVDPEQIEDIVNMINDMGISVYEKAPDAEALLLTEPVV